MAVTSITATTSSSRLCHYVLSGAAHDGSGDRRYVFASGLSCFAPIAAQAFAITRTVRGQQNIIRQAYSVVQSFSREEFDPDDPESAEHVHELGLELARRAFPGHQVLVVTQRDGRSGLLHNHLVVSNVSDRDAELVFRRRPRSSSFRDKLSLMRESIPDGLIEVREVRPAGRAFSSAMANRHRLAHVNDDLLADMEFMQSLGLGAYDNKALMAAPAEKVTKDDRAKREHGEYVWRDDLKLIISEEQSRAVSVEDFRDRLAARRVELRERGKEKHFSFGFIDAEGKARQARALGVRGLGAAFGRQAADSMLEANQRAKGKALKRPVKVPDAVGTPQIGMAPQVPVAGLLHVQEDSEMPLNGREYDTSWMGAVIEGHEIGAEDQDDPSGAVSVPEPSDDAQELVVALKHVGAAAKPPVTAVMGRAAVMSPGQRRALALIENEKQSGRKDLTL